MNLIKTWILITIPITVIELYKLYIDMNCGLIGMSCKHSPIIPSIIYELLFWSGISVIASEIYYNKVLKDVA